MFYDGSYKSKTRQSSNKVFLYVLLLTLFYMHFASPCPQPLKFAFISIVY